MTKDKLHMCDMMLALEMNMNILYQYYHRNLNKNCSKQHGTVSYSEHTHLFPELLESYQIVPLSFVCLVTLHSLTSRQNVIHVSNKLSILSSKRVIAEQ